MVNQKQSTSCESRTSSSPTAPAMSRARPKRARACPDSAGSSSQPRHSSDKKSPSRRSCMTSPSSSMIKLSTESRETKPSRSSPRERSAPEQLERIESDTHAVDVGASCEVHRYHACVEARQHLVRGRAQLEHRQLACRTVERTAVSGVVAMMS